MARGRREYNYTPDYESTKKIAETRGGGYDSILKDDVKPLKPHASTNTIRILPPTWENPKHYGLLIWLHYNVGPSDRRYLCLRENATSPHRHCPVCDALYDLGSRATQDDRQRLKAKPSYLFYVIDRDNEKEGVQVWQTSQKNVSEIAIQSINKRNQGVLNIIDIEDGYDVEFTRTGEGRNGTRYHGFMVDRESTPLSNDDRKYNAWLDYIDDNPLTEVLNFYSPEHIEQVLHGRGREDEDDDQPRSRTRRGNGDDRDEAPQRLRRTRDDNADEDVDIRPRSRQRPAADETSDAEYTEERPRRTRREEDEELTRSVRRPREEPPEDDEPPPRRTRPAREEPEDDPPPRRTRRPEPKVDDDITTQVSHFFSAVDDPPPRRTRLARELDDEVPFDDQVPEERPRRQRPRLSDPEDEEPARAARRGANGEDRHEEARQRVRSQLSRSRDE